MLIDSVDVPKTSLQISFGIIWINNIHPLFTILIYEMGIQRNFTESLQLFN